MLERYRAPAIMPPDTLALFGPDYFSSAGWYDAVAEAAVPRGADPVFLTVREAGRPTAIFPMWQTGRGAGAMTTPYTCLWRPLTAGFATPAGLRRAGALVGGWARRRGAVRLDCLDPHASIWPLLRAGLVEAGLHLLPFDHFGNWRIATAGMGWDLYLGGRPGALREAIRRRTRRLAAAGATFRLVQGGPELAGAIAAYAHVYARSWKEPEPYPDFSATQMQTASRQGVLRLALLELAGVPIAAQIWVVAEGTAFVLKLAHDEAHKQASPGTALTAWTIRHLLEREGVTELDFGRGDDPYKKDWTGERRQRTGLVLAHPMHPAGAMAIARAWARRALRR